MVTSITIREHAPILKAMEINDYPTSLGMIREIRLDDGCEKIILSPVRTTTQEEVNLFVSNLDRLQRKEFIETIGSALKDEIQINFPSEEEYLIFLLSSRWAVEKELGREQSEAMYTALEDMHNQITHSIQPYLVDPYQGDNGARH